MAQALRSELDVYFHLGLVPIPLKPRSKEPLVRWRDGWNPTFEQLDTWASQPSINWAVRCGENLAVLDFDSDDSFHSFLEAHPEANSWLRVRTGRGFHLWVRSMKAIHSQRIDNVEVKCLGSYVVAPPSIHPSGVSYAFEVVPDGALPQVDLEVLLGLKRMGPSAQPRQYESILRTAPSDFALHYGKSTFPRPLCGLATKVLTRSDGKVKLLLSLRDWKWDCPKCAPLLRRYWMERLSRLSFRFILRLPTWDKPTKFLRRLGKPQYVHIVDNGESWLFLLAEEAESVWAEARRSGYSLVAGDIAGNPTPEDVKNCLQKALCQEREPLNTRRKVTHSRAIFRRALPEGDCNESIQPQDCDKGVNGMRVAQGKEPPAWDSEVIMRPVEEVARELESQGWINTQIAWR